MFSEQDVDRELKAALSVSPSPDFAARVLQRVEADRPSHRAAHYGWLAAAASLVIAAGVFYALNRTPAVVTAPPAPQVVEQPGAASRDAAARSSGPRRTTIEPPRVQTVRASRERATRARSRKSSCHRTRWRPCGGLFVRSTKGASSNRRPNRCKGQWRRPRHIGVAPVVVEPIPLSPLGPGTETATPTIRGIK